MIKRNIEQTFRDALKDSPAVFLNGARQSGKSTLVQAIIEDGYPAAYVTFDDVAMLSAAKSDPKSFLRSFEGPVALDEVQRVPELFLTIKSEVDRSRRAGRFILTGSANVLLLPKLAESLAGRVEILTLWPLSQGEIEGTKESFIDFLFAEAMARAKPQIVSRREIIQRVTRGGYPEIFLREPDARRDTWYGSYINTILQRDVRDMAHIEGLTQLPRLLSMLATRVSQLLNVADVANSLTMPQTTLKRYLTLLETTYILQTVPAWSPNIGKRFIKSPKILVCDSGLLTYLLGGSAEYYEQQPVAFGPILENFLTMELVKQISWSKTRPQLFHFRSLRGHEVDLVLEDRRRRVVGIEVKTSGTVAQSDFKNLMVLSEIASRNFHRGVVLYTGSDVVPFGNNLFALPMSILWMKRT